MIPVNTPLLNGNERKYLLDCIDTGWISSEGPYVERLEGTFASFCGRAYGVAVCNGSAAIDIAIEALGIGPGDEVIVPAFTIISCISQIVRAGAIPVLVDSDATTWNMDAAKVEEKVTPRTRAIMIVHIYGLTVDVDPILEIARRYGLAVIEDAAEAHGQTYKGLPCGSFGHLSTFSFYANKHVTTGEGGMLLTDSSELAESFRSLRNLCFKPSRRFVHDRIGWNHRMTNLQAAVGVAQLERLDEFIAIKRRMGSIYTSELQGLTSVSLPPVNTEHSQNTYWVFGIVLQADAGIDAEEAMRRLGQLGIATRPFFCPMHLQPVLLARGLFVGESYPVSEALYKRGFYIPSGLGLSEGDIAQVVAAVKKVLS